MMATPEQRAAWRKLDQERMQGEWEAEEWYCADEGGWAAVGPHHELEDCDRHDDEPEGDTHVLAKRDSAFVASTTVAIPALLDYADERDAEIARLRGRVPPNTERLTEAELDSALEYAHSELSLRLVAIVAEVRESRTEIAKLTATIETLRRVMVDDHGFLPAEFNALLAESEGVTT